MSIISPRSSLVIVTTILVLLVSSQASAQTLNSQLPIGANDAEQKRLEVLSDLQILTARAKRLEKPLARGMAEAEIADAAWWIDRSMAKELLRNAFATTLPSEEERINLQKRSIGAPLQLMTPHETACAAVRRQVMKIALRDKLLAEELISLCDGKPWR